MYDFEEIQDIRRQIGDYLVRRAAWLEDHWFEAHEDLVRDQLIENMQDEPCLVVDRLFRELNDTHRKLYSHLSGEEIVDILKSRATEDQILNALISAGEAYEIKPTSYMILTSWNPREFDEEVFTDEDDELSELVRLLPNDSFMKKNVFTVNVDIGPFYFCVRADSFLESVKHLIDQSLADEYILNLLEINSGA
jgi:hypothetical protein